MGPKEADELMESTGGSGGKAKHDSGWRHWRHSHSTGCFSNRRQQVAMCRRKNLQESRAQRLAEVVADFIKTEGIPVQSACFGVAGPVRGGRSKISNLPWIIDSRELAKQLKLTSVGLINDLEAMRMASMRSNQRTSSP